MALGDEDGILAEPAFTPQLGGQRSVQSSGEDPNASIVGVSEGSGHARVAALIVVCSQDQQGGGRGRSSYTCCPFVAGSFNDLRAGHSRRREWGHREVPTTVTPRGHADYLAGCGAHYRRTGLPHAAQAIHGHWAIEDRLHWVRDMDFDEDRSQIYRQRPRVMAALRYLVIAILRLAGAAGIAVALRHHARRPSRPLRTIMNC